MFCTGLSQTLDLLGPRKYNVGSEYSMNCIATSGSLQNAYITINGTERFTNHHGRINASPYSLTAKLVNIGWDYNATVFQCHAGG